MKKKIKFEPYEKMILDFHNLLITDYYAEDDDIYIYKNEFKEREDFWDDTSQFVTNIYYVVELKNMEGYGNKSTNLSLLIASSKEYLNECGPTK
ncbi:hypothetical protein [Mammaliicoccus fleurettii]|uniref:hypothetical protein n=1 Tax=Mammaliicoccus fleurettii TaxID=150056 RepID=UPI001AAD7332|nr:hypothetical protein [Mammaliicoccus fleurettii]MBO3062762.1 hypothetical protein [Mammaliicoccus fleurettii]